jgi:2-oxoglutarate ferredoxin oxidoreductase subunit gamma
MLQELLTAGFGGQGVMLMGQLLAYAAIYEGLEVTFFPSYGPEMRGGTANCTVVISDTRIGSPVRSRFTALMAMNEASLEKFTDSLKPGGVLAYNSTIVESPPARPDVRVVRIPANEIAEALGNPQVANMVAVGGLVATLGILSLASLDKGLTRVVPAYRHHLVPLNQEAIRRGMTSVQGKGR